MANRHAAAIREVVMHTGWAALAVCAGLSACSAPAALATAYVNTTATCSGGGGAPITRIGEVVSAGLPETSPDGTLVNGHPINIICTVSAGGNGYSLNLFANDNANGNTSISGSATTSGGSNLTGTFITGVTGTVYESSDCTLSFMFNGESSLPNNAVGLSPGLVWGHVSCPDAAAQGMAQTGEDGGTTSATCDLESDFLFENCSQ
jgi:hypothetical protein